MRLKEYIHESTEYTIYVDLDGVLTDFLKGASLATGKTFNTHAEWEKVKSSDWRVIADIGADFWAGLPWTSDGKKLWGVVKQYNPNILSAFPQAKENKQHAVTGKNKWIKRELSGYNKIHLVKGQDKQNFASPKSILIDDLERNVEQFISKGGIGILHKNANDTIKQLKRITK